MIYDVFNFFNELEVLEIRLNELDDFVDRFVLVEGTTTFQGKPKELVYDKNKDLFAKWHKRLVHVIVDDSPKTDDTWAVEAFHYNAGNRGLNNLRSDDVVIWGCVDEIPKKASIKEHLRNHVGPAMAIQHALSCYLNCWFSATTWTGCRVLTGAEWTASKNPHDDFRKHWLNLHVNDGGWHFCNIGGAERWKLKIQSFAHKELNHDMFLDELGKKVQDCYNLCYVGSRVMPWNMLPNYISQNRDKFKDFLIPNESD